jgi:hypothetical protein
LVLSSLALNGCVNTSPNRVKLTASVEDASLSVAQGSLVTSLSGTFQVTLSLGDLASQNSVVSAPPTFTLVTEKDHTSLANLDAVLAGNAFPVTLKPGDDVALSFSLSDTNTLAASDITAVCAGPVAVAATLEDSANGDAPISVESPGTTVSSCP